MNSLLLGLVTCLCLHLASSQDSSCTRENLSPSSPILTNLVNMSLLATPGTGDIQTINIQQAQIVCLAADTMSDSYRGASLVIQYICEGSACPVNQSMCLSELLAS